MKTIITIGRQFGSGGHEIGEKLADHYGIKCFDKELLTRAAKESGFCEEMLRNHDERPTNSFLYNLVMDTYTFGYNSSSFVDMPISHKVFMAQFDTIKKIAEEEACVIVGRCADYALQEYKNCLHIFIHANDDAKVERIMRKYEVDADKAREMMVKKDRQRQSYYNYYSTKSGGAQTAMICQLTVVFLAWMGRLNCLYNTLKILRQKINNYTLKSILIQ